MKAILMNLLFVPALFIQSHHLQAQEQKDNLTEHALLTATEESGDLLSTPNETPLFPEDTNMDSVPVYESPGEFDYCIDIFPHFPGGDEARIAWLKSNLKYPKSSKDANVSGKVYCGFKVEIDGGISEVKILRGLDSAINREVIRVISSMPRWEWDEDNRRKVPVCFTIPINFVLDTTDDQKAEHEQPGNSSQQPEDSLKLPVAEDSILADTAVSSICNPAEPDDLSHCDLPAPLQLVQTDRSDTMSTAYAETEINSEPVSDPSSLNPILKLFPNPCNDWLTVDLKNLTGENVRISIANMQGRLMFSNAVILPVRIDVTGFPSAIYVVKLCEGNTLRASGCFVKP